MPRDHRVPRLTGARPGFVPRGVVVILRHVHRALRRQPDVFDRRVHPEGRDLQPHRQAGARRRGRGWGCGRRRHRRGGGRRGAGRGGRRGGGRRVRRRGAGGRRGGDHRRGRRRLCDGQAGLGGGRDRRGARRGALAAAAEQQERRQHDGEDPASIVAHRSCSSFRLPVRPRRIRHRRSRVCPPAAHHQRRLRSGGRAAGRGGPDPGGTVGFRPGRKRNSATGSPPVRCWRTMRRTPSGVRRL